QRARRHPEVDVFVSTSGAILGEVESRGWREVYDRAGVSLVVGTCTYVTPILPARDRVVMTNSAKWAHYAPANIGVDVVFGSLEECVRSAELGRVWRDPGLWGHACAGREWRTRAGSPNTQPRPARGACLRPGRRP